MAKLTKIMDCGCKVAIKSIKDQLLFDQIIFQSVCSNCCEIDEILYFKYEANQCGNPHNLISFIIRNYKLYIDCE
jgi:hypothetical protein